MIAPARPASDRVERQHGQPDDRPLSVGGPRPGADGEDRGAQIAADAPAHDEVERRQAAAVARVGRCHVHRAYGAPLVLLRRPDHLLDRLGQRGAAAARDQQPVGAAARIDDQRAVDLRGPGAAAAPPSPRARCAGPGETRAAGPACPTSCPAVCGGATTRERHVPRLGVVEGAGVRRDERDHQPQDAESPAARPGRSPRSSPPPGGWWGCRRPSWPCAAPCPVPGSCRDDPGRCGPYLPFGPGGGADRVGPIDGRKGRSRGCGWGDPSGPAPPVRTNVRARGYGGEEKRGTRG